MKKKIEKWYRFQDWLMLLEVERLEDTDQESWDLLVLLLSQAWAAKIFPDKKLVAKWLQQKI